MKTLSPRVLVSGSSSSPRRYWYGSRIYQPNGERECARRRRQGAHINQAKSHLPGTLWPAHLGVRS